jgi:perosamine synthetase
MSKRSNESGIRFGGNELHYVREALASDLKPQNGTTMKERLESAFRAHFQVGHAVSSNSGTSPLHQALVAIGVQPGDEVILSPLSPVMPTFAVIQSGAVPVFADVDPDSFLMDPADFARKITAKSKAVLLVHLYGAVCDMSAIKRIARANNLGIIEDAAQCMLGRDGEGRLAGTSGDVATFSFDNKKHLSSGEGGMLVTNRKDIAERARKFGGLGFATNTADSGNVTRRLADFQDPSFQRHDALGYNYRMSEVAAAVALAQFERVESIVQLRRLMASRFEEVLAEERCDWLKPQQLYPGSESSYWTFALKIVSQSRMNMIWSDFRRKFIEFGGDGIYAAWQLSYNEPAILNLNKQGKAFPDGPVQFPWCIGMLRAPKCPVAENLQPWILQFTTNQQTEAERNRQAQALRQTIRHFETDK